jgi:hypothetical protein
MLFLNNKFINSNMIKKLFFQHSDKLFKSIYEYKNKFSLKTYKLAKYIQIFKNTNF